MNILLLLHNSVIIEIQLFILCCLAFGDLQSIWWTVHGSLTVEHSILDQRQLEAVSYADGFL